MGIDVKKIAKVTRPTLNKVLSRKRLHRVLDQARQTPVVWVYAPPGSGKTTAVSSYIEEFSLPHVWYQVDDGDNDVASFFYFMRVAVREVTQVSNTSIPELGVQDFSQIEGFARGFFRDFYAAFDKESVVVIDDYHEVKEDCILQTVLKVGVEELPPHIQLVFISRKPPSATFAKYRMNNLVSVVDWESLQFNEEECKGVFKLYSKKSQVGKKVISNLYARTDGWAAGIVLLIQGKNSKSTLSMDEQDKRVVFDYFAGEIFEKESSEIQMALLKISVLHQFTLDMVAEISGVKAIKAIEKFCDNNYFITRRESDDGYTFMFHPMFKEFLQNRLGEVFDCNGSRELKRKAAQLLNSIGDINGAARHLIDIECWSELKSHILLHIGKLFLQGRYVTAHRWLKALPDEYIQDNPWLIYWVGVSNQPFDLAASVIEFECAFEKFMACGHYDGAYLSWALAVESIIIGGVDLDTIGFWIKELNKLVELCPEFPSDEVGVRVTGCIFNASLWRHFDDRERVNYWASRTESLLDAPVAADYLVGVGAALALYYGRWLGDISKCSSLIERIRRIVKSGEVTPVNRVLWSIVDSMCFWMTARPRLAQQSIKDGYSALESTGVNALAKQLKVQEVYASLASGDVVSCHKILLDESFALGRGSENVYYRFLKSSVALEEGRFDACLEHIKVGLKEVDEYDTPLRLGYMSLIKSQALFGCGDKEEGLQTIRESKCWAEGVGNCYVLFQCLLIEGQWHVFDGDVNLAREVLRAAFLLGRQNNFLTHPWWGWRHRGVLTTYNFAIENDIEKAYVESLIRHNNIVPKNPEWVGVEWPWYIKIKTLGHFSMELNGELMAPKKIQGKSLELLKFVLVNGARSVGVDALIDSLWPDAEGDSGHHAFETTLYRLRKSLGENQVIELNNACVSVNERYVWVDVLYLERLIKLIDLSISNEDGERLCELCSQICALYEGDFLQPMDTSVTVVAYSDRLKYGVTQALSNSGSFLVRSEKWHEAAEVFNRGVLLSPQTEKFYTELMLCQRELQQPGEIIMTYRRCCSALQAEFGIQPSAETKSLYEAVVGGECS